MTQIKADLEQISENQGLGFRFGHWCAYLTSRPDGFRKVSGLSCRKDKASLVGKPYGEQT
jgi:hypothetical protein